MRRGLNNREQIWALISIICGFLCIAGYFSYDYFEKPDIKIKGEEKVSIFLNEEYQDPGYVATLGNKDITSDVKVFGTVDTSKIGDHIITYSVTNSKGFREQTVNRIVKVKDTEGPKIELKGDSPYKAEFGYDYNDPGYKATDNYDGDLTDQVIVSGNVNTNQEDTYVLIYKVKDSSGNEAEVTRRVKVVDNEAPKIELDGDKKMIIKLKSTYEEPGYSALDKKDGDLTDKVKVSGKVKKTPGIYYITYKVKDSSGNTRIKKRSVQVGTNKEIDYANHVEVSIADQKLWYYKNGKLFLTSNIVSGQKYQHGTPKGRYRIQWKATDTYLVGDDYKTHVNYWMPFNGDVGLHDATWRGSFGGSIYTYNGSHGCVNLPYSVAQKIFYNIKIGTLVIVR